MSNTLLLNISDFNNEWNKDILAYGRKERENYRDKLIDISRKPVDALTSDDLTDVSYKDFLHTRELGLTARNELEYRVKQIGLLLARPIHRWKYLALTKPF